jgi:LysR family transcriptional activator of nhaA
MDSLELAQTPPQQKAPKYHRSIEKREQMRTTLETLNYHHLLYFYIVAREGSVKDACTVLDVSQPTISTQIGELQRAIGTELFMKRGRGLQLTETGQVVYRYANEMFGVAREMLDALRGRQTGRPLTLTVGVPDSMSKVIVHQLLKPSMNLSEPVRVVCREGSIDDLITSLVTFHLDVVVSDVPAPPGVRVRAFTHLLGQCGVSFFAAPQLAAKYRADFPRSLNDAPVILPTEDNQLRRSLDQWFAERDLHPRVVGEFEDSALMKVFGQNGLGIFPAPSAIEKEMTARYGVENIGRADSVRESFYAISVERRLKHPAVVAMLESARSHVFMDSMESGPKMGTLAE